MKMTVSNFVSLNKDGVMFEVVDATKPGYVSNPEILTCADRNVVSSQFGSMEVIGFAVKTKRTLIVYVK